MDKIIWTENNFDEMKWHDCRIYAFAFNEYKLMLDIDYIFEWVIPQTDEKYYKFWVSPVTIVFDNVYDLQIDIESICDLEIRIEQIYREQARMPKNKDYINKDTEWKWVIDTAQGKINFWSVGFNMYIRKEPVLQRSQKIELAKRDGISFFTKGIL